VAQAEQYIGFPSLKKNRQTDSFHQGNGGRTTQVPAILDPEDRLSNSPSLFTIYIRDSARTFAIQFRSKVLKKRWTSYCFENALDDARLYVFVLDLLFTIHHLLLTP
jgi:hypothetical protein